MFQVLEDPRESSPEPPTSPGREQPKWQNVVEFGPPGTSLVGYGVVDVVVVRVYEFERHMFKFQF